MRDITLGDTFTHDFTTRAFATGIPTTLAGTPAMVVHEGANNTFISTGVTLDVDIGGGGPVTGLNEVTVVATSGNGYEAGKSYSIYISIGTVAGVSVVGEVVGHFTIALSAAAVDLANTTDGLTALAADIAALNDPTVAAIVLGVWDELTATARTAGSFGQLVKDNIDAAISTRSSHGDPDPSGFIDAPISTVDTVVDAIKVVTDQMVFTKANELDVNTQSISDATVVGSGTPASPWDGA